MSKISGGEADCRYLALLAGGFGSFEQFLRDFGAQLPANVGFVDLVRLGWLTPTLRVEIPARFITSWENYPSFSRRGGTHPDDRWADHVWSCAAAPMVWRVDPVIGESGWFVHPLDRSDDEYTIEIRKHEIPAGPGYAEPKTVGRPRREHIQVHPWIDYFRYWQAYQLFEILNAAQLLTPILNTPGAKAEFERVCKRFDGIKKFSDKRIDRVKNDYRKREPVFEWLSRFRTLIGASVVLEDAGHELVSDGARRLADDMELTPDDILEGIRGTLLVMWKSWDFHGLRVPPAMRRHFQQDVARAMEFHNLVADVPIDPWEEYWHPADRNPREWALLKDVLPYEKHEARARFPHTACFYIERFNRAVEAGQRFDADRVHKLARRWWSVSQEFRRFCLSFNRLHQHYGGSVNADNDIGVIAQTPEDFLVLCVLHVEKFLSERRGDADPQAPAFGWTRLLKSTAETVVCSFFSLDAAASRAFLKTLEQRLKNETDLHQLPGTLRNPLKRLADIQDPLAFYETSVLNVGILRNYVAHHSCLDFELIHTDWAKDPLESLLVVLLTALEAFPLPKG